MRLPIAFCLAALVLSAAVPARADAARVYPNFGCSGGKGGTSVCGGAMTFEAAPGEVNRVTVSSEPGVVRFTDSAASVTAESPCTQAGPNAAVCPHARASVVAGDRDDEVQITIRSPVEPSTSVAAVGVGGGEGADKLTGGPLGDSLVGGPGDDEITGGGGGDTLTGGSGTDLLAGGSGQDVLEEGASASDTAAEPDVLDGGADLDTVTYTSRKVGVTVDLSRAAAQGAPGEGDVITSVENAWGGDGPDRLVGTDAGQTLDGDKGDDVISAGGGDDNVGSGPGRDRLDGGAGDDRIDIGRGPGEADVVACGAGEDRIKGPDGRDLLEPDCELIDLDSLGRFLAYPVRIRGGVATFRLTCPGPACRGELRLVRADGRAAAALGTGRISSKGRSRFSARVRLTEKAQRLAARNVGVVTRVTYAAPPCSCSWRIRLKT